MVQLRKISIDDLWLYEAIHCDPVMMAELGGPLPKEGLAEKLRRDAQDVKADRVWIFAIILDEDSGTAVGTVSIWDHHWRGESITEIGWMVLPEFQGRGLAGEAVRSVVSKARSETRWDMVHAFPTVTNAPSNAICRKTGFSLIGETDYQFRDRPLRCNHWRLNLRSSALD